MESNLTAQSLRRDEENFNNWEFKTDKIMSDSLMYLMGNNVFSILIASILTVSIFSFYSEILNFTNRIELTIRLYSRWHEILQWNNQRDLSFWRNSLNRFTSTNPSLFRSCSQLNKLRLTFIFRMHWSYYKSFPLDDWLVLSKQLDCN